MAGDAVHWYSYPCPEAPGPILLLLPRGGLWPSAVLVQLRHLPSSGDFQLATVSRPQPGCDQFSTAHTSLATGRLSCHHFPSGWRLRHSFLTQSPALPSLSPHSPPSLLASTSLEPVGGRG